MKLTLQNQALGLLAVMVAICVLQLYFGRLNNATLANSNVEVRQATQLSGLVGELERNVLDLQRIVLIHKETGTESITNRFNRRVAETFSTVDQLEDLAKETNTTAYLDQVVRMRGHLSDFQANFADAVEGRTRQRLLFQEQLMPQFDQLRDQLDASEKQSELVLAQRHLAYAQRAALEYLANPTFTNIAAFNREVGMARRSLPEQGAAELEEGLRELSQTFVFFTQVTRGYVYLVNVVMAGSANEFLFLAREMQEGVRAQLEDAYRLNDITHENISTATLLTAGLIIAFVLAVAMFLVFRLILPIRGVTDVFTSLVAGRPVSKIPGSHRTDEVGELAQAAEVFHEISLQTNLLLEEATQFNEQLERAKQRAEDATESKSMFLANMSHEIRTPMNGIIGLLRSLKKTELSTKQSRYVKNIEFSSQVLLNVINDILDFSKIEAGKLELEAVPFELDSVIQQVVSSILERATEKGLYIRTWISPEVHDYYIGDPLRITQILLNLVGNALKFTERDGITLDIRPGPTGGIQFQVQDTGIGMSEAQVERIFDSFTQADGSTSRKFGGTGLGLTIVKQLCEAMQGTIEVDSELDKGTVFHLQLPLESLDEAPKSQIPAEHLVWHSPSGLEPGEAFTSVLTSLEGYQQPSDDILLLHVTSISEAQSYSAWIEENNIANNLGFVVDLHPVDLAEQITTEIKAPVLTQPYTKTSLQSFVAEFQSSGDGEQHSEVSEADELQFEGHVLLVEDNSINQAVACEMLDDLGITYEVAENGLQAVSKVMADGEYDLVLMDIQMPVMDGYEATRQLRREGYRDLKICGLSANAMKEDLELAKQNGLDDYLTKPIDWDELETTLSRYLKVRPAVQ